MNPDLVLWPVVAQIALTIVLYVRLSFAKQRAARAGQVNEARRALHADAWPDQVVQIDNCIRNQFEIPVLFYVLALVLHAQGAVGVEALALAWAFVALRFGHAYVHTGSNHVPLRRRLFTGGVLAVAALLWLAVRELAFR